MPDADQGTGTTEVENAAATGSSANPLEGFSADLLGGFHSEPNVDGEPESAKAVDESAKVETPTPESKDNPSNKKEPEEKAEEKPDPAKSVNFDGFSDKAKATWERLLKNGHATPDEVEEARNATLRQNLFSKKTTALAREREEFEKAKKEFDEKAKHRAADLDLLDKVRSDEKTNAAWDRMLRGDVDIDGDMEAISAKKAAEIAEKAFERREAQRLEKEKQERASSDARRSAVADVVKEQMALHSLSAEAMDGYLIEEFGTIENVLSCPSSELVRRLGARHELEVTKAELARAKEQLGQKASKQVQTAKQSLPPARRVSSTGPMDPMRKTEADLGIAPDWGNVQGFGFRDGH